MPPHMGAQLGGPSLQGPENKVAYLGKVKLQIFDPIPKQIIAEMAGYVACFVI